MRYPDGSLIGDLNDDVFATSSKALAPVAAATDFNENTTTYDLLPVIVNRPPVVVETMVEASTPEIKMIQLADGTGNGMYVNSDGLVRILAEQSVTFRFRARQPSFINVENGLLQQIQGETGITYLWRLNGDPISSFELRALGSRVIINNNVLTIERIQRLHEGVLTCEASNDIGTITSEPITIEVLEPYSHPLLYTNLIQNPFGRDGNANWNDTGKLTTKRLTSIGSRMLKMPHKLNLFGYNSDTLHPRPYQLEPGSIRNINYSDNLTNTDGTYFTRAGYDSTWNGETKYVTAYQDVDLTELGDLIKGGVFGIEGLRGIFGCYIGNAFTTYIPTRANAAINHPDSKRFAPNKYFQGASRVSLENFVTGGPPVLDERVYVTVEEYDNDTRLPSEIIENGEPRLKADIITLKDPWWNTLQFNGQRYYTEDIYQLGDLSSQASEARIDPYLFAADILMPNPYSRFTFGQHAQFVKVVINKLNKRTTKIRIALHFKYTGMNVESSDYLKFNRLDELMGWVKLWEKNKLRETDRTIWDYINIDLNLKNRSISERFLIIPEPRPMITGLTLGLLPLYNYNRDVTEYQTNTSLITNNEAEEYVADPYIRGLVFDPFFRRKRELWVKFYHRSRRGFNGPSTVHQEQTPVNNATSVDLATESQIFTDPNTFNDTTFIKTWVVSPGEQTGNYQSVPTSRATHPFIFPFVQDTTVSIANPTQLVDGNIGRAIAKYGEGVSLISDWWAAVSAESTSAIAFNAGTLIDWYAYMRKSLEGAKSLGLLINPSLEFGDLNIKEAERFTAVALLKEAYTQESNFRGNQYLISANPPIVIGDDSISTNALWGNKAKFILYYAKRLLNPSNWEDENAVGQSVNNNYVDRLGGLQSNAIPFTSLPGSSSYSNAYYVEIDQSVTGSTDGVSSRVRFWRDSTLPGSGIVAPIDAEVGELNGDFYFKIPKTLLAMPIVSGGLGVIQTVNVPNLVEERVSRQDAQIITKLMESASLFRQLCSTFGDDTGRTVINSVLPIPTEGFTYSVKPYSNQPERLIQSTDLLVNLITGFRRLLFDYLVSGSNNEVTTSYRFKHVRGSEIEDLGLPIPPVFNVFYIPFAQTPQNDETPQYGDLTEGISSTYVSESLKQLFIDLYGPEGTRLNIAGTSWNSDLSPVSFHRAVDNIVPGTRREFFSYPKSYKIIGYEPSGSSDNTVVPAFSYVGEKAAEELPVIVSNNNNWGTYSLVKKGLVPVGSGLPPNSNFTTIYLPGEGTSPTAIRLGGTSLYGMRMVANSPSLFLTSQVSETNTETPPETEIVEFTDLSVSISGTPVFGIDSGSNYYFVRYLNIHDQLLSEGGTSIDVTDLSSST